MFLVQCNGCGASATATCSCPPEMAQTTFHLPDCDLVNLGALVACKPGKGCCDQQHDHDAAANACPGGHTRPCLSGDTECPMTPPGEPCPGGHCSVQDPDCAVCRPVTITGLRGSVGALTMAAGG